MKETYLDFHVHTINSDGACTPKQVLELARKAGIDTLAITDHNYTEDLTCLQAENPDIRLIQGAEISCLYTGETVKDKELHMVALGFDPAKAKIKAVLAHNQPDRQPYIDAILDRLRQCGMDLGTYADFRRKYPHKRHIGRMDIGREMRDLGYVETIEQAFEEYIGGNGQQKAYVPNPLNYVTLEDAVEAVLDAGGVPVLAHLYYYLLNDEENLQLLRHFKQLTGDRGGMEVYYGIYDEPKRMALKTLADEVGLMYSAASDFHGHSENDTIHRHFRKSDCAALLEQLGIR